MSGTSLGIVKFHTIEMRRPVIIFWIIFTLAHILGFVVAFSFEKTNIIFWSGVPVYISASFMGFQTIKSSFPNLIQWGATRKVYFLFTSIFFIFFSLVLALTSNILLTIFNQVGTWYSLTGIHFYHLIQFGSIADNFSTRIFFDFSICLVLISISFLVSAVLFRYGLAIGGMLIIPLLVLTFIPGIVTFLLNFVQNIFGTAGFLYFSYIVLASLLLLFLSWLIMRRSFIVPSS